MKVTRVDNLQVWELLGGSEKYPGYFECIAGCADPRPGMLVTSYEGQMRTTDTGLMGIGVIIAVQHVDDDSNYIRFHLDVLWNWR